MGDDNQADGIVHQTTDYDKFSIIESNRLINKQHVQRLIKSFEQHPDIARTRPILCNQKFEIIDGQHRFEALKELKKPVFYMIEKGLTITDAQRLNSVQKNWTMEDFARSFAMEGYESYQQYLEIREKYKFQHNVTRVYCEGYERHGGNSAFKRGDFKLMKDRKTMRRRLDMLAELYDIFPAAGKYQAFSGAMLTVFKSDQYDHDHFVERFKTNAPNYLTNFMGTKNDFLRVIETIYNKYLDPHKQVRFF